MRIDAHQHFWALARGDYGWLTPELAPIYRDFLPADLTSDLTAAQIDGTVLVQAAPTVAETTFMLSLAEDTPFIKGVVGWVDFEAPDAAEQIATLARNPALVGLRPMIQDIADPGWMLRDALTPAFEALIAHDLTFDALTLPQHLGNLRRLLARHPDMRVVIDHASKPLIKDGVIAGWAEDMAALARDTTAFCKFSGMVTEAADNWSSDTLRPYADHLLGTFGPERLIWGSDWPVCTLASSYARWVHTSTDLLGALTASELKAVWGGNAARAYNLRD
ncbi:amidohydrolase family protein [Shimia sp. MMG029]|uniref:amidohydrolase family protein n=1 Tax=Shimia sp. MMG029 TaxID=3021978 RepID=UPI0022FF263D|nr:amidohydrolase family protein [Shimia sp. MMG029]MDA5559071.1 amidohydrolase family protein [Shimia sp. MMG029]